VHHIRQLMVPICPMVRAAVEEEKRSEEKRIL
ncbi:hypothetical protein H8958_019212, partial [Nasalis larvatus]